MRESRERTLKKLLKTVTVGPADCPDVSRLWLDTWVEPVVRRLYEAERLKNVRRRHRRTRAKKV